MDEEKCPECNSGTFDYNTTPSYILNGKRYYTATCSNCGENYLIPIKYFEELWKFNQH